MESKDGTFTVQSHKPGTGWTKATGTVTPTGELNVKFDNGAHNAGHMDSSWTNMIWGDGSYWTRHGAKPPANAGPKIGKELVLKLNSDIASHGTFFTDSNGREMVKRQRNARGPSYPPYVIGEPVAGNYYPVNSMMSLDDGKTEMAVVTDVSMGGSSMADGSLELMVHRRCQADDSRGVQEPLNETMCVPEALSLSLSLSLSSLTVRSLVGAGAMTSARSRGRWARTEARVTAAACARV